MTTTLEQHNKSYTDLNLLFCRMKRTHYTLWFCMLCTAITMINASDDGQCTMETKETCSEDTDKEKTITDKKKEETVIIQESKDSETCTKDSCDKEKQSASKDDTEAKETSSKQSEEEEKEDSTIRGKIR